MGLLESILAAVLGYYLWGVDGFMPATVDRCTVAKEQLQLCILDARGDAEQALVDEINGILEGAKR